MSRQSEVQNYHNPRSPRPGEKQSVIKGFGVHLAFELWNCSFTIPPTVVLTAKGRMLIMEIDSIPRTQILSELDSLQEAIRFSFEDVSLLSQALVHGSYLNECDDRFIQTNERLEFLGDAILDAIVADTIYNRFPDASEGELTRIKSALVCTGNLARLARSFHIGDYLRMGKGEADSGGRDRDRNLAGTMEAIIGAIFCDQGFGPVREFVEQNLAKDIDSNHQLLDGRDPKSKLQELVQSDMKTTPDYGIVDISGPDHERVFTAQVLINDSVAGHGTGRSKQKAEQEAAREALKRLEGDGIVQPD